MKKIIFFIFVIVESEAFYAVNGDCWDMHTADNGTYLFYNASRDWQQETYTGDIADLGDPYVDMLDGKCISTTTPPTIDSNTTKLDEYLGMGKENFMLVSGISGALGGFIFALGLIILVRGSM